MSPDVITIAIAGIVAVLFAVVLLRSWYLRTLEARLQAEADAHLPMRRRLKRLVRHGARSATEPVQEGRHGWWWIWANVDEEVMGVAWTLWGARRQLEAYQRHRSTGSRPPRHVVVQREQPPRRRFSMALPMTVSPEAST